MEKEWAEKPNAAVRLAFLIGIVMGGSGLPGLVAAAQPPDLPTHQQILLGINNLGQQISTLQNLVTQIPTATRKKYFLSTETTGGEIDTGFCGSGFHMASLWEIFQTSALEYDTTRGLTAGDSGQGPPSGVVGWVRTGASASTSLQPGQGNCSAYTTINSSAHGTTVRLDDIWANETPSVISPWRTGNPACDQELAAWCVED
jgi:hypothetical protein